MTSKDSIIPQKLASLGKSKFRSKFKLTQKEQDYIATRGLETIKEHAFQFVNARVAPDFPKNDDPANLSIFNLKLGKEFLL